MRFLFIISYCLIAFNGYSQGEERQSFSNGSIIYKHANGRISVMGNDKDREFSFVCYYDTNGIHKAEYLPFVSPSIPYYLEKPVEKGYVFDGEFKNSMRDGEWTGKFPGGKTYAILNYKEGLLHGGCKIYDQAGNLLLECNFENGGLHGKYIRMFSSSPKDTAKCGTFTNHMKTGEWKSWYNPGYPEYHYVFSADSKSYEIMYEYENSGLLRVKTIFTDSGKVMYSYMPKTGKLYNVNVFKKKNKNPDRYSYNDDGNIKMISLVTDDITNKIFVRQYYPDGKIQVTRYCINGIDDGLRTTYHPNGKIHSTINRSAGLNDGEAVFYDETGKQTRTSRYEKGVEIVDKKALASSCHCTTEFKPIGQISYFPSLERMIPLADVNKALVRFEIDSSYRGLFMRDYNKNNGSFSSEFIVYSQPKIFVDGLYGVVLNMNPCKNQSLHYELDVHASHVSSQNLGITVDEDFGGSVLDYFRLYFDYYELDELHRLKACCNHLMGNEDAFSGFLIKKYEIDAAAPENEKQSDELWKKMRAYYEAKKMNDNYVKILEDLTLKLYDHFVISEMLEGRDVRELFEAFFSAAYQGHYSLTELKSFFSGKNYASFGKGMLGVKLPEHFFKPEGELGEYPLIISYKGLDYTNDPGEKIFIQHDDNYKLCSPSYFMEKTGMHVVIHSFALDLDADAVSTTGGNVSYDPKDIPFHSTIRKSSVNKERDLYTPDIYLSRFMGAVISGDVWIKTEKGKIDMKMEKCIIDAKEVNGILIWQTIGSTMSKDNVTALLKKRGVEIHSESKEENGIVKLFFRIVK
ncbi:MAG: toxin-antitoxin system YwqK family antitoxin [Bacteroidota bacterium]